MHANGSDSYDLRFKVEESDSDGVVGSLVADEEVSNVINEDIGSSRALYAYFGGAGDRFYSVDNISVQAQPRVFTPPTQIRSYTNGDNGDVFLGGDNIELGMSRLGSFGSDAGPSLLAGFFGTDERYNIGMSTNPAGFGKGEDLRMDFFMPGSPEERWTVGYKQGDSTSTGTNSGLAGGNDMNDNTVTDESSGDTLRATSDGTLNGSLETTQHISFGRADKFFKNEVTLKNVGSDPIESVRYMRNFDPDNTVDQGGNFDTHNSIPYTFQHGDGKAMVVADTSNNDNDPVYLSNGSRSPIFFYSADARARVSTFGFSNQDPYDPAAYDESPEQGTALDADMAINITFDVGTLAPGQSQTVVYYTSLDTGDVGDSVSNIEQDIVADATNDLNGDGVVDTSQPNVSALTSGLTGKTVVLEADNACQVDSLIMKAEEANTVVDPAYTYPEGLMDFAVDCGDPGYTTTIKQYYYGVDPATFAARKYNPDTNAYFDIADATVSQTTIYGQKVLVLTYQVTDNTVLDFDDTPGIIKDPAGLGISAVGAPSTGVRL